MKGTSPYYPMLLAAFLVLPQTLSSPPPCPSSTCVVSPLASPEDLQSAIEWLCYSSSAIIDVDCERLFREAGVDEEDVVGRAGLAFGEYYRIIKCELMRRRRRSCVNVGMCLCARRVLLLLCFFFPKQKK